MAKKEEKAERRRFKKEDRKPWTEDARKEFVDNAEKLRPYIEHLSTPAPTAKKKGFLDDLPTVE